jgi:tyrosyl-tRNA synthetase
LPCGQEDDKLEIMVETNPQKIKNLLNRGVEEVISKKHLEKRLRAGKKLRVKFGIDPTSADLHLGHAVPLRKLKEFQDLGHQVIFLIGDFTALIGDPSGRIAARRPLKPEEIKKNMANYVKQAAKILDIKKVEVRYNSEWYGKKRMDFLMDLASHFTFARLIERSEFKKRIAKDIDITMLELLYPLMQGYDSVELKADVEIGGTDQKFNLLMGRRVQKKYGQREQDIMTLPLLIGTDGVMKMSKSYNNYIKLTETAFEIYGKIMSIPDKLIWHYLELLTDFPLKEIEEEKNKVYKRVLNPREVKAKLAREIVRMYHGKKAVFLAEKEFLRIFKEKKLPAKIPKIALKNKKINLLDLLTRGGLASSKTEAKRLIVQGGVKIDGRTRKDWREEIELKEGQVVQVGKKKFLRIK